MGNVDKRGILDEEVFSYRVTKDKKVFISYHGKQVTTLSGNKADRFIADIENTKTCNGKSHGQLQAWQ